MRGALAVLAVCLAAASCGPKKPTAAELDAARRVREAAEMRARADEQTLRGCYDCLLEARAAYSKLATGTDRPEMLLRLFETELLLALREKELAIDAAPTLARARVIASELPATASADRYLKAVEVVPPDATGLPFSKDTLFRRGTGAYVATIDNEIAWMLADPALRQPVRQYLALSLDCSYFRRGRPPAQLAQGGLAGVPLAPRQVVMEQIAKDAPPIVQYRMGTCQTIGTPQLNAARKEDARWAEAAYFLARAELRAANETGAPNARPLIAEAYARFPNSPAVTYLAGNYNQLIGDCKAGLKYYEETIAIEPVHDNALLGRTVCLAFLKRFDDSIASATQMIAVPTSNLADAYYWRAWVRHYLKDLTLARADIEKAKGMLSNNAIHRLAGIIEHDQDDLLIADKDLTTAKSMSDGQYDCVARWYLGLNDMKRGRWTISAAHFEDSMNCYERAALFAEVSKKKMETMKDIDEDFRARQIAGFEAAIKEDRAQQYASAFNAANHYARGGDPAKAKTLLEVAAKDPALEVRVAELRKILAGGKSQNGPMDR